MKPFQATAVRVCGLATLVIILVALADFASYVLSVPAVPPVQMATGVAFFVAITGFCVANIRTRAVAESVSISASGVIAVLSALYVYKFLATPVGPLLPVGPSLNALDAMLVFGLFVLLFGLCRSVWREDRPIAAA